MKQNLSPEFQPPVKEKVSPGIGKMMKQVETLRTNLQPESDPSKSSCSKRSMGVKNKRSIETTSNDVGDDSGDEINPDQLGSAG